MDKIERIKFTTTLDKNVIDLLVRLSPLYEKRTGKGGRADLNDVIEHLALEKEKAINEVDTKS